jgi:hypothetical protein
MTDNTMAVILRFTATSDCPLVLFGHCIVCRSSVYGYFWLPFGIVWPLHCLSFFCLRILLITLWYLLAIVLSVILRFTATSDYPLVLLGLIVVILHFVFDYLWYNLPGLVFVCRSLRNVWRYQVIRSRKPKNDRQYNGQAIPKDNKKWP